MIRTLVSLVRVASPASLARLARSAAFVASLGLVFGSACSAPAPTPRERAEVAPTPRTPRWSPRDPVRVRLTLERCDELVVRGAERGDVRIARAGGDVRVGGESPSPSVRVRAAARGELRVGDRAAHREIEVRADPAAGLRVDVLLDLETYVRGVVAAELSLWSAEPAEIEAQAIASRSYAVCALTHRSLENVRPYLFDDTRDQAWRAPRSLHASASAKLDAAIERTRGLLLWEGDRVVDARFCASCGGRTAAASDVAPEADFACLRSVECVACMPYGAIDASAGDRVAREGDDRIAWRWTASSRTLRELAKTLAIGDRLVGLRPTARDPSGRWLRVEALGDRAVRELSFTELRRHLGEQELKSAWIESTWPRDGAPSETGLAFIGRGFGHGVGLCQRGARAYAARGWSSERILRHYFPGASIAPLPEP